MKKRLITKFKTTVLLLLVVVTIMQCIIIPVGAKYGIDKGEELESSYDGFVFHIKSYYGKYLDVINAQTGDGTYVWTYNFNINAACQEWRIIKCGYEDGENTYHIQDVNSGKLLSIPGSMDGVYKPWIWHDDGTDGQIFKIRANSDGTFCIFSKCSGYKKALVPSASSGASGSYVYQRPYVANDRFKWTFELAGQNRYLNGIGVADGDGYLLNNYGDDNYGLVGQGPCQQTDYAIIWQKVDNVLVKDEWYVTWWGIIPILHHDTIYKSVLHPRNFGEVDEDNCYGATTYRIIYEGKGYYSIKFGAVSLNDSYLTYDSSICNQVILESKASSGVSDKQLWKIELCSGDSNEELYTISPKTAPNYKMYSDGCDIRVGNKSDNTKKWRLICEEFDNTDRQDCLLVSTQCFVQDDINSAWIGTAEVALSDMGLNSFRTYYEDGYSSLSTLKKEMQASKFVCILGHGWGKTNSSYTSIRVNNKSESTSVTLKSNDGLANWGLSDVDFVMFCGCCTAANWSKCNTDGLHNLLTSACQAGASMALGFDNCVDQIDLPRFLMNFYSALDEYYRDHPISTELTDEETKERRLEAYREAAQLAVSNGSYPQNSISGHCILLEGKDSSGKWNFTRITK